MYNPLLCNLCSTCLELICKFIFTINMHLKYKEVMLARYTMQCMHEVIPNLSFCHILERIWQR